MRRMVIASVIGLALVPVSASADDQYLCEDGRFLTVTNANRAQMMQDPCIRSWFDSTKPKSEPKKEAENGPKYEGGGVMKAVAEKAAEPRARASHVVVRPRIVAAGKRRR